MASETGLVVALGLRAFEIGLAVLVGLIVCPPLLILTFLVVAPLVAAAIVVSLVAAVLAAPYLLVRHLRGHPVPHASVFTGRVRHAGRADRRPPAAPDRARHAAVTPRARSARR